MNEAAPTAQCHVTSFEWHDNRVRKLSVWISLSPQGGSAPATDIEPTQIRGAVNALLGGTGHDGWTPWRWRGAEMDAAGEHVTVRLVWLPDHLEPARWPTVGEGVRFGSWTGCVVGVDLSPRVTREDSLDRMRQALASPAESHRKRPVVTVATRTPVALRRRSTTVDGRVRRTEIVLPDEAAVLESIAGHWNSASRFADQTGTPTGLLPPPCVPDPLLTALCSQVAVAAVVDIRSESCVVARTGDEVHRQRAFSGTFALTVLGSSDAFDGVFGDLMGWAAWCGVGDKVATGLGWVDVVAGNAATGRDGPVTPRR